AIFSRPYLWYSDLCALQLAAGLSVLHLGNRIGSSATRSVRTLEHSILGARVGHDDAIVCLGPGSRARTRDDCPRRESGDWEHNSVYVWRTRLAERSARAAVFGIQNRRSRSCCKLPHWHDLLSGDTVSSRRNDSPWDRAGLATSRFGELALG